MTSTRAGFELVGLSSAATSATRESRLTWVKPEFEFVDLCCEVTLYLYHQ